MNEETVGLTIRLKPDLMRRLKKISSRRAKIRDHVTKAIEEYLAKTDSQAMPCGANGEGINDTQRTL